jgi:hypothetical protein
VQLKLKFGLGLLALGMVVFAGWNLWINTRNFVPVNLPVSLVAGQTLTSEFKLDFDGLYLIETDAEKTLPLNTLHCLMGVEADAAQCKDISPALGATWILYSNGQELRHGSSQELHSAPVQSRTVARVIGEFQGKAGQAYKLQVTFTTDGRNMAPAHPRLKVGVSSIAYTDMQSAGALVFSTAFVCVLFGVVLLSIAWFARRGAGSAGVSESS